MQTLECFMRQWQERIHVEGALSALLQPLRAQKED